MCITGYLNQNSTSHPFFYQNRSKITDSFAFLRRNKLPLKTLSPKFRSVGDE